MITVATDGYETLWENYFLNFKDFISPSRKPSLFEWLYNSYKCLYLSCVDLSMVYRLADLKTCLCIVDSAVDDSCDNISLREQNGGDTFSYEMLSMLYNVDKIASGVYTLSNANLSGSVYVKTSYYIFSDLIRAQIKLLPRYYDFRGEFFLAIRSVAESMEFSYLLNKNKIVYPFSRVVQNRAASTMVEVHSLLDLMSSENFDASELGKAVTLFKMADIVAMLGNTVNTWKREIIERDYSCPVISLALEKKLIKFSDFEKMGIEDLKTNLSPVFGTIENEINKTILSMKEFSENCEIKSFDTSKFINSYASLKWQTES